MEMPDFAVEHLKRLPLRAIVAFAARCGRRVQHLAPGRQGDPGQGAIEAALGMAEDFARGAEAAPDASVLEAVDAAEAASGGSFGNRKAVAAAARVAHAATAARGALKALELEEYKPPEGRTEDARNYFRALEHLGVELAALNAFTAAAEAHAAVGYHNESFVAAALNDYDKLIRMKLGRYPEPGEPIDPSPSGPLGPL